MSGGEMRENVTDWKSDVGPLKSYDLKVINRAKTRYRTDIGLAEWAVGRHHEDQSCLLEPEEYGEINREHATHLTVEDFIAKYERPNLPVCIDGIVQEWPAWKSWDLKQLYKRYRHSKFRSGDDDDGYAVRIKLKYFLRYMCSQIDDSPLYIFDSRFPKLGGEKKLLSDYEVPKYFREDLFRLIGEKRRPPYRWFLIGPKRSGSNVHIDPLGTSAWNALISGRKRWILFPPHVPKKTAKAKQFCLEGEDDEPIDYFTKMLPRLKAAMGSSLKYVEFVQHPGETVFVPGGWWHAVLNLDDTVAVTQNFVSTQNFPNCWVQTRKGRRGMARLWYRQLKIEYPELAKVADRLNEEHGYDLEKAREEHHRGYREKLTELRRKRRMEKRRRQLTGENADKSSSSSGDLVDSDWTSLSGSLTDFSEEKFELDDVGMSPMHDSIPRPPSPLPLAKQQSLQSMDIVRSEVTRIGISH